MFARTLFRLNSREHRDARIKSSPIISNERNIEEYMTNRENKVSWINLGWWPRENKVTRIISVLQYIFHLLIFDLSKVYMMNNVILKRTKIYWPCTFWFGLFFFRINVDLAIFQPYLDLEAGDNQSLKIQVARPGIEPRSSCSASQELNHSATAAPTDPVLD